MKKIIFLVFTILFIGTIVHYKTDPSPFASININDNDIINELDDDDIFNGDSPKRSIENTKKHENVVNNNKDVPFCETIECAKERLETTKKVIFVYGQNCCAEATKRLCTNAFSNAHFDECFKFNASALDEQFAEQHKDILNEWRGAGYWLWKPYLINKLLLDDKLLNYGDYLVYMDAGAYPKSSFNDMFEFIETNSDYNGVLFFGVGLPQKQWCKRDAYILQNCDEPKCWDAGQINAFLSFWRKSSVSIKLSKMWLNEASNKSILTDSANNYGQNFAEFREHRHDQAVITNIMNREGYKYGPPGWQLDDYIVHDRFTF